MKKQTSKGQCGTSKEAQTATLRAIPQSTGRHKDPKVKPIGSKAMTGGNTK